MMNNPQNGRGKGYVTYYLNYTPLVTRQQSKVRTSNFSLIDLGKY